MAPRQPRRMVDPDYAGQIRAGIGAKLNGQMTSSNSFKAFQTPMTGGYNPAEMEGRRRAAEVGAAPVRDKFNPAVAQNVVDNFGFGVGADGKFQVNPAIAALNFLPFGKVVGGLGRIVGRVGKSLIPFESRIGSAAARLGPAAQRALPGAERLAAETTKRAEAAGALLRESRSDAYKDITALEKYSGMDYAGSWYGDLGTHAERLAAGRRPMANATSAAASRAAARLGQTRRIAADASEQLKDRFERFKRLRD